LTSLEERGASSRAARRFDTTFLAEVHRGEVSVAPLARVARLELEPVLWRHRVKLVESRGKPSNDR
jgi:hypothetical protein